ncbi:hypothetical protein F4805DRAFT_416971 [Annulohypoxylon moriforme]|nr:hypothetical protein F4805DRAFT_416971 [Annulohypoxylon moriforme]
MDLPAAPNGLWNRWNLTLIWGICAGPNCFARDNLLKCGGCRAISYCGAAHQVAHRPEHKLSCNLIKKSRAKVAEEEAALRARPGDEWLEANPFETARGSFWHFHPTRPYMESRFVLIRILLDVKRGEAVEEALKLSLESLDLCRGDNQGARHHVPALYLRLGRDQEAYDFTKWWGTIGAQGDYPFGDLESPYLNLHDEDIFEPLGDIANKIFDLSMLASLTNIKVRLLLDIMELKGEFKKPSRRNASYEEKMEWVRENARCDILYKRRDIVERTEWEDLVPRLLNQAREVYSRVEKRNKHYWPALRFPDRYSAAQLTIYTPGSREEVILAFRNTWYSWSECPSALELVTTGYLA